MTFTQPHTRRPGRTSSRGGFSLTEVLLGMVIFGLIMSMTMKFFNQSYEQLFISDMKNRINHDIRVLTAEMSTNARQAFQAFLYKSFQDEDRNAKDDRQYAGGTGDFLLLVYKGTPDILLVNPQRPIERIVGYYRWPKDATDPDSMGPVRKFDIDVPVGDSLKSVESLIPSAAFAESYPQVVELSEGLADGKLFYNHNDISFMVNGKIVHGTVAKRVTDTYNFTVSPRSQVSQL